MGVLLFFQKMDDGRFFSNGILFLIDVKKNLKRPRRLFPGKG